MKELIVFIRMLHSYSGKILYINLLGMTIVSFLDGAGMILLVPMMGISGIVKSEPSSIWGILDLVAYLPNGIRLPFILAVYIALVIGQNFLNRNLTIRDIKIQQGFINKIKEDIYYNLLHVKWDFYLKTRKTNIISTLTKDINRVTLGIKMLMQLLSNLIFTIIQVVLAFFISTQISSLVIICGLGLAFFSWRFVKQSKNLGKETTQLSREYLAGITDNLNGMKEIKTNISETPRMQWLKNLNYRMLSQQVDFTKLQTNSQLAYKTALALIIASFIFSSVHLFHTQPQRLLVVILLFSRLWPRFVTIQSNLQMLATNIPAFKVILDLKTKTFEKQEVLNEKDVVPLQINKSIECRNICFRYDINQTSFALTNIHCIIPANCMTAIVGPSGAGKSTLVDILMGLITPESGELFVDGFLLTDDKITALRKTVSFVPQDPFIFNATIRQNLSVMAPHASEEEMWEALEFSAASEFVKRLPRGLDTGIGDRGISLSGGERQRLVLARAILRRPSLLVLDEATSALDIANDEKIQKALAGLKGIMTVVIIAHRKSTIRNADQVIELNQGMHVKLEDSNLNSICEKVIALAE